MHALKRTLQTKGYPSDALFRARLPDVKLYGHGGLEKKAQFLLETLERSYKHKEPVDFAKLTIEHVMPQKLTDDWRASLGAEWQTTHDLYLHTLGNLTLTGYNGELSNAPFIAKRKQFLGSHLELNRYFQKVMQWQRDDIMQRAAMLTECALRCWPYFGDTAEAATESRGVTGTTPDGVTVLGVCRTWGRGSDRLTETG